MEPTLKQLLAALAWACMGCADASTTPAVDLAEDRRVTELNAAETAELCHWSMEVAQQSVPPSTMCEGRVIRPTAVCTQGSQECAATVGEFMACLPALLQRVADMPCDFVDAASSLEGFADFIDEVPACEGFGHCATMMSTRE